MERAQTKISRLYKIIKLAEKQIIYKNLYLSKELAQEDNKYKQANNLSKREQLDITSNKTWHKLTSISPGKINTLLGDPFMGTLISL